MLPRPVSLAIGVTLFNRARATRERLRRLAAIGALGTPRKRLPKQVYPRKVEDTYAAELASVVAKIARELKPLLDALPFLLRERADGPAENARIKALLEAVNRAARRVVDDKALQDLARLFANRTVRLQREEFLRQIHAGLGADVFLLDRNVPEIVDAYVESNVSLIKNVREELLGKVETDVTRAIQDGVRHEDLAEQIQARLGVSERRAELIARDQVGKLYGQVNAERQKELGITHFIWNTSNDERVRPEHQEREGKRFAYADPPDDGLPGEPVNCRCTAEPDLSAILDDDASGGAG